MIVKFKEEQKKIEKAYAIPKACSYEKTTGSRLSTISRLPSTPKIQVNMFEKKKLNHDLTQENSTNTRTSASTRTNKNSKNLKLKENHFSDLKLNDIQTLGRISNTTISKMNQGKLTNNSFTNFTPKTLCRNSHTEIEKAIGTQLLQRKSYTNSICS